MRHPPKLRSTPSWLCRGLEDSLEGNDVPFVGDNRTQMPDRITHDILAEIVEIAADAIICMDAFQRITFFNKGAEAIFGWTSDEIVGQRIEMLIPERYRS